MSKTSRTIELLRKGWQTPLSCAMAGGCLSLSQRCGEFFRDGINVQSKWVKTSGGSRVKAYRIVK